LLIDFKTGSLNTGTKQGSCRYGNRQNGWFIEHLNTLLKRYVSRPVRRTPQAE
jgi:hypothetical protein